MGVCGAASLTKNDKQNKNKIKISINYNDEQKKDCLINKNEKLSAIIKELGLDEEADYDFYDSNNVLINDKIDEEVSKIFNNKKDILLTIKQAYLKLAKDNRKFIQENSKLISTLTFNYSSSLGLFIYNTLSIPFGIRVKSALVAVGLSSPTFTYNPAKSDCQSN